MANPNVKYALCPGWVRSKVDGDRHYISSLQLARLYKVHYRECWVYDPQPNWRKENYAAAEKRVQSLICLHPRYDGDYTVPEKKPPEKNRAFMVQDENDKLARVVLSPLAQHLHTFILSTHAKAIYNLTEEHWSKLPQFPEEVDAIKEAAELRREWVLKLAFGTVVDARTVEDSNGKVIAFENSANGFYCGELM